MKITTWMLCCSLLLSGCEFQHRADEQFGDQHFKTAIALIELHKTRFGAYPENLQALQFTGGWDALSLQSVDYKKQDDGYTLVVARGWVAQPDLAYPEEFWQGLGIKNRPYPLPVPSQAK